MGLRCADLSPRRAAKPLTGEFSPASRARSKSQWWRGLPGFADERSDRKFERFPCTSLFQGRTQADENDPSPGERRRVRQKRGVAGKIPRSETGCRLRVRRRRGNVGVISRVTGTRQLSRKCVADREETSQPRDFNSLSGLPDPQIRQRPAQRELLVFTPRRFPAHPIRLTDSDGHSRRMSVTTGFDTPIP